MEGEEEEEREDTNLATRLFNLLEKVRYLRGKKKEPEPEPEEEDEPKPSK